MRIANHTRTRMAERGITIQDIATCLQYGVRMDNRTDPANKYTYVDNTNKIYVVTDKANTTVITVFHKER